MSLASPRELGLALEPRLTVFGAVANTEGRLELCLGIIILLAALQLSSAQPPASRLSRALAPKAGEHAAGERDSVRMPEWQTLLSS